MRTTRSSTTRGSTTRTSSRGAPRRTPWLLVVLLAAVALLAGGCSAVEERLPGGGTITVTALLRDSAGLFVGNDVGVLGVPVGEVVSLEPAGAHVRVEMRVDADRPLPADVGAVVVARSVATDRYVELTPVWRGGPQLQDGAEVPIERTRTPVDFDAVLGAVEELATGVAGSGATRRAVDRLLTEGARTLRGRGPLLNRGVTALGEAVDSVAQQRGEVVATVESVDRLLQTLAGDQRTTRRFVREVAAASRLLAAERDDFRRALRALDRAVTTVARFAVDNRTRIRAVLRDTSGVARSLTARQRDLAEVLEVMPLTFQNLERAVRRGRVQVRIDPTVLLPLSDQLSTLCGALPVPLCEQLGLDPPLVRDLLGQLLGGAR